MKNTTENSGGFYAVIPAYVRYDKSLSAQCKLLYAEITALTNVCGYCWATNAYFAELYGVDEATVSRWIKKLSDKSYIKVERVRKSDGTYKQRKIYIIRERDEEVSESEKSQGEPRNSDEDVHIAKMQCGESAVENDHMTKMQCGQEHVENSHIAKMQCGQKTTDSHIANLQNNHIAKMQDNNIIYNGKIRREKPSDEGVNARPPARESERIPTLEQVRAYCRERRNSVDPQRFFDFYQSNGWRVGKNPMRDWQAALRRWETDETANAPPVTVMYEQYSPAELSALFTAITED